MPLPISFGTRVHSLRVELLLTIAILVLAALVVGIGSVVWFGSLLDGPRGALLLAALIVADVTVLVLFGAHQLRRLVVVPLANVVAAAEAIASGDLARRVPVAATSELAALARSFNRMTDHLLEERGRAIRNEKLASVGRLAAGIAHEIGNPLSAIGGYAHLLRTRVGDAAAAHEALNGIERESARIDRIVRGLLDYSRPQRLTPVPADLHGAIEGAAEILMSQGVMKKIDLRLELASSAPKLWGARHELEQLFVNLFLNAVDAMQGEGSLTVRTECAAAREMLAPRLRRAGDPADFVTRREPISRQQGWLERIEAGELVAKIVVADSGPGVPDADVDRIFDPFYTTKEPGRGTGLGLAIVARIVENLRGVVWVQPARGHGAAFAMLFPVQLSGAGMPALPQPASVSR